MTTAIVLYGVFMASKTGKTGLTPTVNARSIERATGTVTSIASGASAFTVGDGVYGYQIAAATPQTHDYIAVFITADATVDAQHVQAVWPPLAGAWSAELANLDAAISSRNATTPPTVGAVADAVWDEALAGHATAGSAGAALAAAGGAADPLTNTVPGSYAQGTAGYVLGSISPAQVTIASPVATDGTTIAVVRGDDYLAANSRALTFTGTSWPTLTDGAVTLKAKLKTGKGAQAAPVIEYAATVTGAQACQVELTDTQTAALSPGLYAYDLEATLSGGAVVTLVQGEMTVIADVR